MKFIKLSIFALTMGLFIASCGNGEGTEGTADSVETVEPQAEIVEEPTPAVDTTMAPQADTTAVAPEAAH